MTGLEDGPVLGRVSTVAMDRVEVEVADAALAALVRVSDLLALSGAAATLVAIVEEVTGGRGDGGGEGGGATLRTRIVGSVSKTDEGVRSFRSGAALHPSRGSDCHLIDGPQLTAFMALLVQDVAEDERLVLGRYVADRGSLAIADGNRLLQRHVSILGNTGAGKSWTVALLLERAGRLESPNIIVLDLHGEYGPLSEPSEGRTPLARGLRIAGPADQLYVGDEVLHLPFWLLELDELLSLVLNEADPDASDQRLCASDHIQTLKRSSLAQMDRAGLVPTATADSPVPYKLEDLLRWLKADDVDTVVRHPVGKVDPGPYAGKLGSLISRIESRAADPRFSFIFHAPEKTSGTDWLVETATKLLEAGPGITGIKTIDMSEVPAAIVPMVAGVLARLVHNVQFWMMPANRTPVCIVCDEAHIYLPAGERGSPVHRAALEAFEAIAKEGRKYGVCLAVVSQRPSDVSRTILSQCNNFIVMRLTNDEDQQVVEHLVSGHSSSVVGLLPMLEVGEAVVIGDAVLLPARIKLDAPQLKPASVTMPFWSRWSDTASDAEAIAAGVEALRSQWRGDPSQ